MAQRLKSLNSQLNSKTPGYVQSSFDYLSLSSFLTVEQNNIRLKIRKFTEEQVIPHIDSYVEEAKFPQFLIPKLKQIDILQHFMKPPYGSVLSTGALGSFIAELARGDAGVCTMVLVQWGLVAFTIQALGSEQQKARYLPKLRSFEMIGGWGLTEDKIGSDASNLQTSVSKTTSNQYKLNGIKRWIGNGNRDLLIIWARNTQNKKVQGYIIQNNKVSGLTTQPIKNKLAMRVVQNCHITLNNVIVDGSQKLPLATDFNKGTNVVLKHSRMFVCWVIAGVAMGSYDHAIKYVSNRKQFNRTITGFQLVQERVVRMMANVQAIFLLCFRMSNLVDKREATIGQIAMTKAWVSERARQVVKLSRQIYGGNGIVHENYAMKALADMEGIYTYEGTYDINSLVAGRQITGVAAFK